MRERLSSRLGFILLSAGCAIGLGNVWRFPYIVGQSGGGWFLPIYCFALAAVGVPVLVMEFAVGRAAQGAITVAHARLTPQRRGWAMHGILGLFGAVMIMMFYTAISGWVLIYMIKMLRGSFVALDAAGVEATFQAMLSAPGEQIVAMAAVTAFAAVVCACGLKGGLERITKWMMLALLAIIAVLAVHSIGIDRTHSGLKFFLLPDTARFRATGVFQVTVNAFSQAFYTISIGIGAMGIFGSYIDRRRSLTGEAALIVALDTFVAVMSGLIILPACFAYAIEAGQGPGLIFVTLPNVFNHMAGGRWWGTIFFLFMLFAAVSTVLTIFETVLAGVVDRFGFSRRKTCAALAVILSLSALPCIFGFNLWAGFQPFGAGSNVLDLEDFVFSVIVLPVGSLAFAYYCTRRYGWGWECFLAEANAGAGARFPGGRFSRLYCAYAIPAIIVAIITIGLVRRFAG